MTPTQDPGLKLSFVQIIAALKARFQNIDAIELYEPKNDMAWGIDQLADAIQYDGGSLHDPYFEMAGDVIHEHGIIDGVEYNLSYDIRI